MWSPSNVLYVNMQLVARATSRLIWIATALRRPTSVTCVARNSNPKGHWKVISSFTHLTVSSWAPVTCECVCGNCYAKANIGCPYPCIWKALCFVGCTFWKLTRSYPLALQPVTTTASLTICSAETFLGYVSVRCWGQKREAAGESKLLLLGSGSFYPL